MLTLVGILTRLKGNNYSYELQKKFDRLKSSTHNLAWIKIKEIVKRLQGFGILSS